MRRSSFRRSIAQLDERLSRRLANWDNPILDRALPALSRAADHGRLWMLIAALLARFGKRSGKRAAVRGMLCLALTSVLVNLPLKILFRRKRPTLDHIPLARRAQIVPRSKSFPSGHSASAAAFATSVAMESSAAAGPVATLAAGVALSRVYTGVHHPSDVFAGVAIGSLMGLLTRMLWRRDMRKNSPEPSELEHRRIAPMPEGYGLTVVANGSAGSGVRDPADRIQRVLPRSEMEPVEPDMVRKTLLDAAARSSGIGVSGGDGTVATAAGIAVGADRPLAVFPSGTLNHFATDIGVSKIEDVAKAVDEGAVIEADVAYANDRVFLNTASIGMYPEMVELREQLEDRLGKWLAMVVSLVVMLKRGTPTEITIDGAREQVWTVFIGNCLYSPDGLAPAYRRSLTDGLLDVRILRSTEVGIWQVLAAALRGRLGPLGMLECRKVTSLVITANEPLVMACDGETFEAGERVEIAKPGPRLKVFA